MEVMDDEKQQQPHSSSFSGFGDCCRVPPAGLGWFSFVAMGQAPAPQRRFGLLYHRIRHETNFYLSSHHPASTDHPKARELMVQFVKSLGSPIINNQSYAGGWTFSYAAPQGQVSIDGNIVVFIMDDGSRLQARFYRSDKEIYKQLDEEIGRLFDEEAKSQGLDIP